MVVINYTPFAFLLESATLISMPKFRLLPQVTWFLSLVVLLPLTLHAGNFIPDKVYSQPPGTGVGTITPAPPTLTSNPLPTCDLCGWCNQAVNPKPSDWDQCNICISQPRSYWTVLGCLSTDPSAAPFVKSILSVVFAVSGGLAFLSVLMGSVTVLTSAGDPLRLRAGKDMLTNSLMGLFLIIFSIFLLRVVGVEILRLPGFG